MVGVEGFELSTSSSQSWRSTRLSYTPPTFRCPALRAVRNRSHGLLSQMRIASPRCLFSFYQPSLWQRCITIKKGCRSTLRQYGAPGEIRTPDHQVRSLVLYPTELRAREPIIVQHRRGGRPAARKGRDYSNRATRRQSLFPAPPASAVRRKPIPSLIATFLVPEAERAQVCRARADTGI